MMLVSINDLATTDLYIDAIYQGGRRGNAGDDPLPKLMRVDSQGGFRYRGKVKGKLEMLVLVTNMNDTDWPDSLDPETGIFTYYGDNKKPGRELHQTGRDGNLILRTLFQNARSGADGRGDVPPVFVFASAGVSRDVRFLGLAVPGASDLDASEELVAIWRSVKGERFQNYRSRFTILDAPVISRTWIDGIIAGAPNHAFAPDAWIVWRRTGRRKALAAGRTTEYRSRAEQLPDDSADEAIIRAVRNHFKGRPHAFEHCAGALARLMVPDIAFLDVTRPSRDGGRDAIGQLRVGVGPSGILVEFALEAKCYTPPTAVGVRDMSRLISRLRHRQFGILVTTSCVDLQAYKEIKEDRHPILIIAARDIVELLRRNGRGSPELVSAWLAEEFPTESQPRSLSLD
ncbi:restriction endonuclease [Burkholderia cepacia]|uniref:restriction endonuclease n=1 Tax=Burkholderia cepacia TaxID=292 RepID=UPI00264B2B62|nr:restriction endonuclease [Burkholderia cepacia]MDN7915344.1 restriction endonuclease [Burkholderia cepacia]